MDFNSYNFRSQDVFLSDSNPSNVCIINDNKLVIVYETMGFIKIYDLTINSEENKPIITIPLIESNVRQLVHSEFGNYFAIFGDNQKEKSSKTVRVYCNYWIEEQPIRVRAFGSLAHTLNGNECDYNIRETVSSEVIEFNEPLIASQTQSIACCESSANLSICCGHRVVVYCYQTYKYSNNVIKADFVFLLDIRLQWFATKIAILEHYIAVMSKSHCSLLRIIFDYEQQNGIHLTNNSNNNNSHESDDKSSDNKCIEWDFDDHSKTIRLPSMFSISDGQQVRDEMMAHSQQVIGPVDQSLSCKFTIRMNHSLIESPICRASIEVLFCQYFLSDNQLIDIDLISFYKIQHYSTDPLNVSSLTSPQTNTNRSINSFKFQTSNHLIGSALTVLTKSHFHCYNIFNKVELKQKLEFKDKIMSFKISKIDDTLHILTDKGLETYALNFMPLFLDYKKSVPILKINFKTFLNVDYLLNTKNYLLLVTQMDNTMRTIYSLRKPSLQEIYSDINAITIDTNTKLEDQLNLMSYINSVLHFSCVLNAETDTQLISIYHKCCANLANILIDVKHYSFKPFNTQKLAFDLINSSKLHFSHLINFNLKFKLILHFLRNKLESNEILNIADCELSSLKSFLIALYKEDCTLLCRFSLNQLLEYDVRQVVINLLQENTLSSQLCQITLSKLLLDSNQISEATHCLTSLEEISAKNDLLENYKFLFLHNCFVKFMENCIPNVFYQFLLLLTDHKKSVKLIYNMLGSYEIWMRHNFLITAYNKFNNLFDSDLILDLIVANVNLLCDEKNELSYKPIESIDKKIVIWIERLPPIHSENECFCVKCNKITSDLYLLLYNSANEDIKKEVNNLFNKIDQKYEWLFTGRLLAMNSIDAIELLLNDFPLIVFSYISDVCNSDAIVMKQVIHLLEPKVEHIQELDIDSNYGVVLSYVLNELALMLSPEEFINILPQSWKEFAMIYVEKCIINFQSKKLKEKIINLGLEVKTMLSN